jgi:uncharacterized protein YgfB (UPF0149 family)
VWQDVENKREEMDADYEEIIEYVNVIEEFNFQVTLSSRASGFRCTAD